MIDERREFALDIASVPAARHYLVALLSGVADDERDLAALLVTEVATNAVVHAATAFSLRVVLSDTSLRVEASDLASMLPALRDPSAREPTGRGLRLVESLASDWGVSTSESTPGKTIWFTLALVPHADAPSPAVQQVVRRYDGRPPAPEGSARAIRPGSRRPGGRGPTRPSTRSCRPRWRVR